MLSPILILALKNDRPIYVTRRIKQIFLKTDPPTKFW
jgi:hypothetical protein